jgi:RNA recognition motif-containing protein
MADSIESHQEWLYIDTSNIQKGPVTETLLVKMLEKGIGVSGNTLVWKAGMETWKIMAEADVFMSIVKFHSTQWFFVDAEGQQRGPMISRMIMHKLHEGQIDGLTLVYSSAIGEWKKMSEVDSLKEAISKVAKEEEAAEAAAKVLAEQSDQSQQVYFFDEEAGMQAMLPPKSVNLDGKTSSTGVKKSFTADNGVHYQWDDAENDWVECENYESDDDEEEEENKTKNYKKKTEKPTKSKRKNDDEEEDEEDDEDDDNKATEKNSDVKQTRKRKKRQKKVNAGPNCWVYVSGLPRDITEEELKNHFSKLGLIAISAMDQRPKIKVYREKNGDCKGDCSICYNAEESKKMAINVLDGGYIRPEFKILVKEAEFQAREDGVDSLAQAEAANKENGFKQTREKLSKAQVKTAKNAMRQALAWNEDDDMGISKSTALRIVVIEGMFSPSDFLVETFSDELEGDIASECGKCGQIEKITVFSKHPQGVVIVKFGTSYASQVRHLSLYLH